MKFKLEMNCGNAAFEGDATPEIGRILHNLAQRVEEGEPLDPTNKVDDGRTYVLHDINGNKVGTATVEY
jgi:hypothetical protein